MKFLYSITLLGCCLSAVSAVNNPHIAIRSQQGGPGSPISLDHQDNGLTPNSFLNARCNGGLATLLFTSSLSGTAIIKVGNGGAGCEQTIAIPATNAVVITTGEELLCDRRTLGTSGGVHSQIKSFLWQVYVDEEELLNEGAVSRQHIFNASIICNAIAESVLPEQLEPQVAPLNQEGVASYQARIPFTLKKSASSTLREWVLELQPVNPADLNGLSYSVGACTATPDGAPVAPPPPRISLISDGCLRDRTLRVSPPDTASITTLRMGPFRFKAFPAAEVITTCSVQLCTAGECPTLKPFGDPTCATPGRSRRSITGTVRERDADGVHIPEIFFAQVKF